MIWDLQQPKVRREFTRAGPLPVFAISHDGQRVVVFNSAQQRLDFLDDRGRLINSEPVSSAGAVNELLFAAGGEVLMVKQRLSDGNESRYTFYEFSSAGLLGDELSSFADDRSYTQVIAPRSKPRHFHQYRSDGRTVHDFVANETTATFKLDVSAMSADLDRAGTTLVTSGASPWLQIWELQPDQPPQLIRKIDAGDRPGGVAFSPDDQLIVTASSGRIRFWDVATGKQRHTAGRPSHRTFIRRGDLA